MERNWYEMQTLHAEVVDILETKYKEEFGADLDQYENILEEMFQETPGLKEYYDQFQETIVEEVKNTSSKVDHFEIFGSLFAKIDKKEKKVESNAKTDESEDKSEAKPEAAEDKKEEKKDEDSK